MASQFQFVMRSGPTPGATFSLEGDQLTIGRDSSNGVSINDAEVSRKHARLTFQGGKYVIEDLGSTNGTFVNGQRVTSSAVLKSGDVVSLGEQIVLLFETLSVDPGATMASPRKARATAGPAPAPAAPMPAPAQNYAGQAPASPARKGGLPLPILIGAGVLIFICVCGGFFYWVDASYRWCVFFPFLSGCG